MDKDLLKRLRHAENELRDAQMIVRNLKAEIIEANKDGIAAALRSKDDPFGTVTIENIKFNVPKQVKWDQDKLEHLYKEIGETANEYIKIKYDVSESAYKAWPSVIKEQFEPARTVNTGSITFEVIE